jgi:hypothetical protein
MSQWKQSNKLALGAITVAMFSLGFSIMALACRSEPEESSARVSRDQVGAPVAAAPSADSTAVASELATQQSPQILAAAVPSAATSTRSAADMSSNATPVDSVADAKNLAVKRFVVTTAVHEREPAPNDSPLVADGNPIYAFAELVNADSSEQKVSVTFERKGSSVRVGNATLTVPAKVPRYRTWANTRYIREPGTWEAVLSTSSGMELSRVSFEVAAQ